MADIGISVALLTPFTAAGPIDTALMARHAADVMAAGARGVTLFGTTGEGASIALSERPAVFGAMTNAGIPAEQIFAGICATSTGDALAQIDQAAAYGINTFLLLPPFYFPAPGDAGLREWHAHVFAQADPRAKFILYHIPQLTHVPLSFDLVIGLRTAHPDRVIAIKDSSGDWDNTERLLKHGNVPVLVGDERLLHRAVALGAAGSICGMSNLYPARLNTLFATGQEDAALSREVNAVVAGPVVPALKTLMAAHSGNAAWGNLRAPLSPLPDPDRATLLSRCKTAQTDE
ncbi:dihydrodipicolinate synthase family protein [Roseobacter denitrificans]|uniref:Dihydrodipicolinate synthase, putative n=1 Tax=Roseobacter denitrificans (strain ATCC 33942 / OCh 114) TaxID=375451 RepID=Q16C65_ROSDO|nr:dihydrodipicolinate synthase family protein [Roseobacter denitrificans]ABG30428.1 dihydrodipicolinate synthase, putative [Roseobacter denitrificans OCh 114]AVL53582.1 dihydrodipicolinate synthase family protein [Roseobacter denitrificans]SFF72603.1 4-hydroxy-tetrahydrodipicolinate synthase [Roseobacter denitrificans OCh 114]